MQPIKIYINTGTIKLLFAFYATSFLATGCRRSSEENLTHKPATEDAATLQILDETEVLKHVKENLVRTFQTLTPTTQNQDTYVGKLSLPEGRKIIVEFTLNFDQLEFEVSKHPQSQYDKENNVEKFDIRLAGGINVRAKRESQYPYLYPWTDSEPVADTLDWKWTLKNSPDEGTLLWEHKRGDLARLGEEEALTVNHPEPKNESISKSLLASFENELQKYFHIQPLAGNDQKVITWLTNRPGYAEGIYIVNQACGQAQISAKTFEIDKEAGGNGIKQRGVLYYVVGPYLRMADRDDKKWSQWKEHCTVIRCYYQIDSNDKVQWAERVAYSGEVVTTENQTSAWIYNANDRNSIYSDLASLNPNISGWSKFLAEDRPSFSLPQTYPLSFLDENSRLKNLGGHTMHSIAKHLSATENNKGFPILLPMKLAQILESTEHQVEYLPEAKLGEGKSHDENNSTSKIIGSTEKPSVPTVPEDLAAVPDTVTKTASGLASKVLKEGTGKVHPKVTDTVKLHYSGWTADGNMFDSSVARGEPALFPLNGVIAGLTEGVQLMVEGEKRRFWIPASLAYGDNAAGGAPTGMLVFDVELLDIQ